MKATLLFVSAVTLFAFVSAVRATPTFAKGKAIHVHEIHRDQSGRTTPSATKAEQSADTMSPCRSYAEREMINPG